MSKTCKILGFTQYKDDSFHLEIELPYEIIVPDKTKTSFIRLFFDKESYVFLNMKEPEP